MKSKGRDKTTTVEELKRVVQKFRDERGWVDNDPKDMALSMVLESAELLEHFQWMSGDEVMKEKRLREPISDELSDVLWWVLVLSERLGIDLSEALRAKMKKHEKRYPASEFSKDNSKEEQRRAYYRMKAKARGGHPLAEEEG